MIGVIIFGSEIHDHRIELPDEPDMYFATSWAYVLCCVAVGMYIFIVVLGVAELYFSKILDPLPWQAAPVRENIDLSQYVNEMENTDSASTANNSDVTNNVANDDSIVAASVTPY